MPKRIAWALDEEKGPRLLFGDREARVYLADLTGDGPTDLVPLSNREVSSWPNRGHGNFGLRRPKILRNEDGTAAGEELIFDPSLFEQRRIRSLDLDGTGSVDIAYLGTAEVQPYSHPSATLATQSRYLCCHARTDLATRSVQLEYFPSGIRNRLLEFQGVATDVPQQVAFDAPVTTALDLWKDGPSGFCAPAAGENGCV